MMPVSNKMRSDSDEDTELEGRSEEERLLRKQEVQPDHRAPYRADILGSIAGANPSEPGYLGKIDQMITAHGAMEMLPKPTMRATSDGSTGGNTSGNPTGIPLPAGRMNPSAPEGETPAAPTMGERPTLMKSGTEESNYDFSLRDKPHIAGELPGEVGARVPLMGNPQRGWLGKIGHIASKMANVAGDIFAPGEMALIPGTELHSEIAKRRAEAVRERQQGLGIAATRANAEEYRAAAEDRRAAAVDRRNDVMDRRNDILEEKQPRQTPDQEAIASLQKEVNPKTGKPYTAYEARVKLAQDIQDTKPERPTRTSPFEAFAYGTPEEKKSAQDFLSFEKRMGSQYQKPTEAEFRYLLFQRDPEGYKAVFGDKAATADRAHATEMLKFFQKQRDAISKDFMLGDDEKAEQLREIDGLEKPFKEAAGVGGGGGGAGGDRVNVVSPDGIPGSIPRSQLKKAQSQGYTVAGQP